MLQVAGSLVASQVRAYDLIRMMTADGHRTTGLGRAVFFANLGQLRRGCERGMEDQLGVLGLWLNAIVYWNSVFIDAAVKRLAVGGRSSPAPRALGRLGFRPGPD